MLVKYPTSRKTKKHQSHPIQEMRDEMGQKIGDGVFFLFQDRPTPNLISSVMVGATFYDMVIS